MTCFRLVGQILLVHANSSVTNECDALESNNTLAKTELTENIPSTNLALLGLLRRSCGRDDRCGCEGSQGRIFFRAEHDVVVELGCSHWQWWQSSWDTHWSSDPSLHTQ